MIFEHSFGQASGLTLDSFDVVAARWIEGKKLDAITGESHLVEVEGAATHVDLPTPGVLVSVFRSRTGQVHVAHRDGALFTRKPDGDYTRVVVRATLLGMFGLDDDNVYAWGVRGADPIMLRRTPDGDWDEMPSPTEMVFAMDGEAPDRLVAVGMRGSISLFDGRQWVAQASPAAGALGSVHWVSEDEIYACGTGEPHIIEGSVHGWGRRGPFELPLHCIAKHSGALWVGCGLAGLHRLADTRDALELVKPNIEARHFDAREHLLASTPTMVVATADGQSFEAVFIQSYVDVVKGTAPSFPARP